MAYKIIFTPAANKQLDRLPVNVRVVLKRSIDALADNPRPHGAQKLTGGEREYRIRTGDYRVIYEIRDDVLVVVIIKMGHRRDIYR
jgi:mRNA interferase RelE/StbE